MPFGVHTVVDSLGFWTHFCLNTKPVLESWGHCGVGVGDML